MNKLKPEKYVKTYKYRNQQTYIPGKALKT